jgi:hypothetical protein
MGNAAAIITGLLDRMAASTGPFAAPAQPDEADQVDNTGAGASPVTPPLEGETLNRPATLPAVPVVTSDAAQKLAGAAPPVRLTSMSNVRLTNGARPVRIVPGADRPRVVLVALVIGPGAANGVYDYPNGNVYLSTTPDEGGTGWPMNVLQGVIELVCQEDLWVHWPTTAVPGATVPIVAFAVEPDRHLHK